MASVGGSPLASRAIEAYIEIVRNTPLTLQLFFWIALTHELPSVRQSFQPLPSTYLSIRGVFLPWLTIDGDIWPLFALVAALVLVVRFIHKRERRPLKRVEEAVIALIGIVGAVGWIWLSGLKVAPDLPVLNGFNIVGGLALTLNSPPC